MSTIAEMCDGILARIVERCEEDCSVCGGTGRVSDLSSPPTTSEEDGYTVIRYRMQACAPCSGGGRTRPSPLEMHVAGPMALSLLLHIQTERESENFGNVNELIDWGADFAKRGVEAKLADEESRREICERLGEIMAGVQPSGAPAATDSAPARPGALTPEELAELGLVDEASLDPTGGSRNASGRPVP